jgi:hypothetical protein
MHTPSTSDAHETHARPVRSLLLAQPFGSADYGLASRIITYTGRTSEQAVITDNKVK